MANIYNGQLDAFDLYHRVREIAAEEQNGTLSSALPSLGHAVAGSTGAALSNVFTYPLDLIITRLQTQRHLRRSKNGSPDDEYRDLQDAVKKIYEREGLIGFYTGLLQDTGKTIMDSFLFFLVYSFLRNKRLARFARTHGGKVPSLLPTFDELSIGFVAGGLTKLVTTPIANIVTRKQTSIMASSPSSVATGPSTETRRTVSTRDIVRQIHAEKGLLGFWSGYSASLILTLNPSLTFFLFEALKRFLLPRARRDKPPPSVTFLLAAISKACASSVTYPFSLAKARMQAGSSKVDASDVKRATIFHSLFSTAQSEGLSSLHEGLPLEILKGFFSHGITMLLKQTIHSFVIKIWMYLSSLVSFRKRSRRTSIIRYIRRKEIKARDYYDLAMHRSAETVDSVAENVQGIGSKAMEKGKEFVTSGGDMGRNVVGDAVQRANETVDLVRDYVDLGELVDG